MASTKKSCGFVVLLAFCLWLTAFPAAAGNEKIIFEGIIGEVSRTGMYGVVNEEKILLTEKTEYFNHKEKTISLENFRPGRWVYGVGHPTSLGLTADRLYLLPGPVREKEKSGYPFMLREEEDE